MCRAGGVHAAGGFKLYAGVAFYIQMSVTSWPACGTPARCTRLSQLPFPILLCTCLASRGTVCSDQWDDTSRPANANAKVRGKQLPRPRSQHLIASGAGLAAHRAIAPPVCRHAPQEGLCHLAHAIRQQVRSPRSRQALCVLADRNHTNL